MGPISRFLMSADARTYATIVVGLLVTFLAWALGWLYGNLITRPKKILKHFKDMGIPGYPFRAIVGQLPELVKIRQRREQDSAFAANTNAAQWFIDSSRNMGPLWTFSLGFCPRLAICDPTLVRQAYVLNNECFDKSEALKAMDLFGDGLLTANPPLWTWQRRLINPAFNHKEIKRIYPTMVQSAVTAIAKLEHDAEANPNQPIDMDARFSWLTLDIICRSAFGSQLEELFEVGSLEKLMEAFEEYLRLSLQAMQLSFVFPWFKFLPVEANRKMWKAGKKIRNVMDKIVSVRMERYREKLEAKAAANGSGPTGAEDDRTDLLELMMGATKGVGLDLSPFESFKASEENGHDKSGKMTDKPLDGKLLMDNSLTFLIAGHETTAQLLTWTTLLLSQHPEWQERAREEVNILFTSTGGGTPTFDQLNELKVCGWILNESLRLYSPASGLGRTCNKTVELRKGLTVPKGCEIMIPIAAIHLDKELWGEDADEFKPDRFANGISKASKSPHAFMPFSVGPRVCIGQNFALAEAKVILALFLRKFAWRVSDEYRHFPEQVLTVRPKYGLPTVLTPTGL